MTLKQKKRLIRISASSILLVIVSLLPLTRSLKAVLFLLPYFAIGYDVLLKAVRNIFNGNFFDEQFLMSIATVGAFATGEYVEAVAVMLFYQVGELFQSIAVGKSRKSIARLMSICPETAVVIRNGKEITLPPSEVCIGETIIIRPGEKLPLDGTVISGNTTVNTSALTGESLPVEIFEGDRVISGSVNLSGVITVKVESRYEDSTVAKILDLVENSTAKKAKTENFITRFAKYYTPCIVTAAVLLAVIPPVVFHGNFTEWLHRALIFLVISCPCALVISVPLSFFGGIGGASRSGILIKGAGYLETLSKVKTFVFDKTGTLTRGNFTVTAVHPEKADKKALLELAALAEIRSNHPIAKSVTDAVGAELDASRISKTTEHAGMGIEAVIDGKTVYVGNGMLMEKACAAWHGCHRKGTVIHISEGSEYLGHIVVEDVIKPEAKSALCELGAVGIKKTVMLTGDKSELAECVGKELGITDVKSELLPTDKVTALEKLLDEASPVAFVGDGINDAPVLARADVGIAMGAMGSDAAIEAADIVLMDDNPLKLAQAVKISRKTMRIVKQNITFALAVKAIVLFLGAVGKANMWVAVFADVGVMVLAILNSMRTMKISSL